MKRRPAAKTFDSGSNFKRIKMIYDTFIDLLILLIPLPGDRRNRLKKSVPRPYPSARVETLEGRGSAGSTGHGPGDVNILTMNNLKALGNDGLSAFLPLYEVSIKCRKR